MARISDFQSDYAGSIPVIRSGRKFFTVLTASAAVSGSWCGQFVSFGALNAAGCATPDAVFASCLDLVEVGGGIGSESVSER